MRGREGTHGRRAGRALVIALLAAGAADGSAPDGPVYVQSVDKVAPLPMQWRVMGGDDPRWAAPTFDDQSWPTASLDDYAIPAARSQSIAWYRQEILLPKNALQPAALEPEAQLGFSVGSSMGSYEVYIDGERLGEFGQVAPEPIAGRGPPPTLSLRGHLEAGTPCVIAIRSWLDPVSREAVELPRFWEAPLLGPFAEVQLQVLTAYAQRLRDGDHEVGVAAVLVLVAMFHILTWLLRRDLTVFAWYALGLLLLASWHFSQFDGAIDLDWVPHLAGPALSRYGISVIGLLVAVFLQFAWRFLGRDPLPMSWRALQILSGVLGLASMLPNAVGVWFGASHLRIGVFLMITLVGLGAIGRAAAVGRRDAQIIFVGVGLFVIAAFLQAFGVLETLPGNSLMIFGEASMVLGMAVALSHQFARSLDTLDLRNAELVATNKAIERFVPYRFLELLERKTVAEFGRGDAALMPMSVMFCDLRGFTSLAESLGPEATFKFINEYLAAMEPNILSNGGFVNQYLGDGIMSLFHTSSDSAVSSAARMAEGLRALNVGREQGGLAPLRIGVGIHTGPLMLGIIGGENRLSPGVVGDAVNVAARIEGMTKIYGVTALVSDTTRSGLLEPGSSRLRELDRVMAKGKTEAIGIHEVLDADPAPLREAKLRTAASFAASLEHYRRGDFSSAREGFEACLAACPADGPARVFLERCQALIARGPLPGWSGITVLETK